VAGLSQDEFEGVTREIMAAWNEARTRDDGLNVIVNFGRKYGFKNVIAAIQGRTPRRFTREQSVSEWVDERKREESDES